VPAIAQGDDLVMLSWQRGKMQGKARAAPTSTGRVNASRNAVPSASGAALDPQVRAWFEARFGRELPTVRVHTGPRSALAAQAYDAEAHTVGRDIVFSAGTPDISTAAGGSLLAHELAHALQQPASPANSSHAGELDPASEQAAERDADAGARSALIGSARTWQPSQVPVSVLRQGRSRTASRPADPGTGTGMDVVFVLTSSVEDPKEQQDYIRDMTNYVRSALPGERLYEVADLDGLLVRLLVMEANGERVRRLRIVGHGSHDRPGEQPYVGGGGRVLTHDPGGRPIWIGPDVVLAAARDKENLALMQKVMTPDALVEFWGCSLGGYTTSARAWATLFQRPLLATAGHLKIDPWEYWIKIGPAGTRNAQPGEQERTDAAGKRWLLKRAMSSAEAYSYGPLPGHAFDEFLQERYLSLVAEGQIASVGNDPDVILPHMRQMFDAQLGAVRALAVPTPAGKVGPGQPAQWNRLWRTFEPRPLGSVVHRERPQPPPRPPELPTDIPVREPSRPLPPPLPVRPHPPEARPPAGPEQPLSGPAGSVLGRIAFGAAKDTVGASEQEPLFKFVAALGPEAATVPIRVDGYASTDGPRERNLYLARRRAESVQRILVATYGLPASHVVTYAHGETSEFSQRDRTANRVVILSATPRRMPWPVPAEQTATERQGRRDDPHLLASGADTAAFVARQLPTAAAITLSTSQGPVLLTPGVIWGEDKLLVLATPQTVYYTIGHNLYKSSTSTFLRAYWIDAFSAGARRAEHWVVIANVEIVLLEGIFVPWYLLLGISAAKLGIFYLTHREVMNAAIRQTPRVLGLLVDFYQRYPVLFEHLAYTLGKQLIISIPRGVGAEDVAFFLGRLLRGAAELPEVTLMAFVRLALKTAALVALAHLPGAAAHGVEERVTDRVKEVRESMAREGVSMSEEEARVLVHEFMAHPDAEQRLRVLEAAFQDLVPALRALSGALRSWS
jgi:outer membrane protein OmpA-like peptidoglycan-associated protein